MSKVSAREMDRFFHDNFRGNRGYLPETILAEPDHVIMKAAMGEHNLRPGGFVSGPTQMQFADHIAYAVIFTRLGITPMALTSNLNIDFLRPLQGDVITAEGKMIKLGKSLALIGVDILGESSRKISSRATVTYSLPLTPNPQSNEPERG